MEGNVGFANMMSGVGTLSLDKAGDKWLEFCLRTAGQNIRCLNLVDISSATPNQWISFSRLEFLGIHNCVISVSDLLAITGLGASSLLFVHFANITLTATNELSVTHPWRKFFFALRSQQSQLDLIALRDCA